MFAMHWFFSFALVFLLVLGNIGIYQVGKRIYPDGNKQALVTTCQIENYVKKVLPVYTPETKDGYIIFDHSPKEIKIIERHDGQIKVEFLIYIFPFGEYAETRWVNEKDVTFYLNKQDMAAKIKELEAVATTFLKNKAKKVKKK